MTERITKMLRGLRLQTESLPAQFNQWLGSLPGTNFQIIVSAALAEQTFILLLLATVKEKPLEPVTFGLWLGFVAAYGGITYKTFKSKRDSYDPNISSKQNTVETPNAPHS